VNRQLGPIRQTAYVVRDIEAEMRRWVEELGVGPWFYVERAAIKDFVCRGKSSDPHVSIALANSGPHQIELIQQRDNAPTLYKEFTDAGRYGLHHIAYWTLEFDARLADLAKAGYQVAMSGSIGANGRFAYALKTDDPDTIIELSEIAGRKGKTFEMIAEAARTWDGTNPIRRF
jgi:hypothetical protein